MNDKKMEIGIKGTDETAQEFVEAWKRAEAGEPEHLDGVRRILASAGLDAGLRQPRRGVGPREPHGPLPARSSGHCEHNLV